MLNILFSPLKAIALAKSKRNIGNTILILFVASVLASLNGFVTAKSFSNITLALAVFVGTFLFALLVALLLKMALYVLSQRGGYFEALTAVTYGIFITSCGYLVSSLIGLIPSNAILLTVIGSVLSGLVLLFTLIMSNVVVLRTAMELFEIDLFTVLVALIIVYLTIFSTLYFVLLKTLFAGMAGTLGSMGSMSTLPVV